MASIIKVDALQEKTSGNGIVLENSLKDSTGANEVISPSGSITIPSGQSIKNSSGTSLIDATGTISSDMVFPAGHVVQVVGIQDGTDLLQTTSTSWAKIPSSEQSITTIFDNSKILYCVLMPYEIDGSAGNGFLTVHTSIGNNTSYNIINNSLTNFNTPNLSTPNGTQGVNMIYLDTPNQNKNTTIYYSTYFWTQTDADIHWNQGSLSGQPTSVSSSNYTHGYIMEITV